MFEISDESKRKARYSVSPITGRDHKGRTIAELEVMFEHAKRFREQYFREGGALPGGKNGNAN